MFTPTYHNIVLGPKEYAFGIPDARAAYEESDKPVVQVLQIIKGQIIPTPARYYAEQMARLSDGASIAIDYGQDWYVGKEDTAALREYARALIEA